MAIKSRLKFGTSSDDTLNGTDQSEIFLGFGGNDIIFARGGNELALGGGDQLVIEDAKLSDLHAEQFIISSQIQGPTSSQTPYLVSANSHVTVESLITTGDQALNGYTMVGIPDGLGAFDNGNGTFTVLMNHEISNSNPALAGAVRAHGANGAFLSEWVVDTTTLQVV